MCVCVYTVNISNEFGTGSLENYISNFSCRFDFIASAWCIKLSKNYLQEIDDVPSELSPWASALFEFLPPFIRSQV